MFVQAGFNPHFKLVAHAYIAHRGWWLAQLIRVPGNDLVWRVPGTFRIWAEDARVRNVIAFPKSDTFDMEQGRFAWPSSPIDGARA